MSCKCQRCGRQYRVDIIVPDRLWNEIKPKGKPEDSGMLCGPCIMEIIEQESGHNYFNLLRLTKEEWNLCMSGGIEAELKDEDYLS